MSPVYYKQSSTDHWKPGFYLGIDGLGAARVSDYVTGEVLTAAYILPHLGSDSERAVYGGNATIDCVHPTYC